MMEPVERRLKRLRVVVIVTVSLALGAVLILLLPTEDGEEYGVVFTPSILWICIMLGLALASVLARSRVVAAIGLGAAAVVFLLVGDWTGMRYEAAWCWDGTTQ